MYAKILIAYVFLCGIFGYKFTCNSIPRLYQTPLQQRCLQTILAYYNAHQVTDFYGMLTEQFTVFVFTILGFTNYYLFTIFEYLLFAILHNTWLTKNSTSNK